MMLKQQLAMFLAQHDSITATLVAGLSKIPHHQEILAHIVRGRALDGLPRAYT